MSRLLSRLSTLRLTSSSTTSALRRVSPTLSTQRLFLSSTTTRLNATPKVVPSLHPAEAFLSGPSASYIEEMYASWLKDPNSVHVSWQVRLKSKIKLKLSQYDKQWMISKTVFLLKLFK